MSAQNKSLYFAFKHTIIHRNVKFSFINMQDVKHSSAAFFIIQGVFVNYTATDIFLLKSFKSSSFAISAATLSCTELTTVTYSHRFDESLKICKRKALRRSYCLHFENGHRCCSLWKKALRERNLDSGALKIFLKRHTRYLSDHMSVCFADLSSRLMHLSQIRCLAEECLPQVLTQH